MKPWDGVICDDHGWLYNMGTPPRTKVTLAQAPVSARVLVFDLAHALAARDLVPSRAPWQLLDTPTAARLAHERWRGDALALRAEIDALDAGRDTAPDFLKAGRGALLGWSPSWEEARRTARHELCTDLGLTVEVLARRVGDLLLLARPEHVAWERLFGTPFALDDERFAAVPADPIAPAPGCYPDVVVVPSGGTP
ncbi:MAG: hypothetical protein NTY35_00035 [Planctomycetota bacterium]|nr:hypothetical protein [Planctomycetota bacterium]